MYLPALPALSGELGATMAQTQLTLSAGILGLALGQVIAGPSSDALGRRRPLLIGMAAFALASLLCIIAPSVAALTVLRFVQGVAGAAGIAIALAIVSDLYAGSIQARVFSLLMLVSGLAPIIAPVIGSQLLAFTSWHGIFVSLALIGIVLLLAVTFGLGETLPVGPSPERWPRCLAARFPRSAARPSISSAMRSPAVSPSLPVSFIFRFRRSSYRTSMASRRNASASCSASMRLGW